MPTATADEQVVTTAPAPEETPETTPSVETAPAETTEASGELSLDDIQDLSPDEIDAYLYKGKAIEIPEKPNENKPAEVETTPVVEAEAEVLPEAAVEPEAEMPGIPKRIATEQFDEREKKALQLMHVLNTGKKVGDPGRVSIRDAMEKLDTMEGGGKSETPPAPSPVETISTKVTELDNELKTLRQQKKEAAELGESVSELEDQIDQTQDAIRDEKIRLAIEQDRKESSESQAIIRERNEIQAKVGEEYPDIFKPETILGAEFRAVISELKQDEHVDNKRLFRPDAPKYVLGLALDRLAARDGLKLSQAYAKYSVQAPAAAPAAEPKPALPPVKKVLPASGSQATTPPQAAPNAKDVLAEIGDDADAAFAAVHGTNNLNYLR